MILVILDKVQVGLMAVISILSLTRAQVVSGTCLKLVLLGVIKQPRMQARPVTKLWRVDNGRMGPYTGRPGLTSFPHNFG